MLPIAKFVEPNYGKLAPFVAFMIVTFYLALPTMSMPCYYGTNCHLLDVACVGSPYDALSSCEKAKAFWAVLFSVINYLLSCLFFLAYKLLRNEAYSYYYEQG